jgi:stage III sporulation protein AD
VKVVEIIQVVGIGLIAALQFAFLITVFTGVFLFLLVIGKIGAVINVINELANRSGIPDVYLKTILKIIGIAYVAEFGAQMVRDAGQESIASKIEFAGKIFILVLAIPIINVIIETLLTLLPLGSS